jgi:hypothetical protein
MSDDDCLHCIDSVHADDLGTRHHPELTGVRARRLAQASPKSSCLSRIAGTHDDENSSAAPEGIDRRSACAPAIAADDEIDGSAHCVGLSEAGPPTMIDPLSVCRNASSVSLIVVSAVSAA